MRNQRAKLKPVFQLGKLLTLQLSPERLESELESDADKAGREELLNIFNNKQQQQMDETKKSVQKR